VLHSGIYYGPDTLKARVCSRGAARMMDFAEEQGIPYRRSGKVRGMDKEIA
jgi:L-2-hydroxyglutarate oxidase